MTFEAAEVPMLCPPLPWTSPHSGAFLLSPTKLMRSVEGTMQHQRLLESCPPTNLHGALDTLTQLGNCAWRVNGRVLDLVLTLFNKKGCPRLGVPAPASEAPRPPENRLSTKASPERKVELRRQLARCLKVAREMHSLRTDALYRLSLAQHLRNSVFWLPHNMDFRGRTYPCPPHFNHLGSDLARALLEFAQGRPLGPHGLDWLKIHLVNLTGLKKRESLQARLAFADEMMNKILDSADKPMTVGRPGPCSHSLSLSQPCLQSGSTRFSTHLGRPLGVPVSRPKSVTPAPLVFPLDKLFFWPFPLPQSISSSATSRSRVALIPSLSCGCAGSPTLVHHFCPHPPVPGALSQPPRILILPRPAQLPCPGSLVPLTPAQLHLTHCPPAGPQVVDGGRRALASAGLLHGDCSGCACPQPRCLCLPFPCSPGELVGTLRWSGAI